MFKYLIHYSSFCCDPMARSGREFCRSVSRSFRKRNPDYRYLPPKKRSMLRRQLGPEGSSNDTSESHCLKEKSNKRVESSSGILSIDLFCGECDSKMSEGSSHCVECNTSVDFNINDFSRDQERSIYYLQKMKEMLIKTIDIGEFRILINQMYEDMLMNGMGGEDLKSDILLRSSVICRAIEGSDKAGSFSGAALDMISEFFSLQEDLQECIPVVSECPDFWVHAAIRKLSDSEKVGKKERILFNLIKEHADMAKDYLVPKGSSLWNLLNESRNPESSDCSADVHEKSPLDPGMPGDIRTAIMDITEMREKSHN